MRQTVYLVYHGFTYDKANLCGIYADERLARLAAEGFVDPPRAWFGANCVHTGRGGWSMAYIETWQVRCSAKHMIEDNA